MRLSSITLALGAGLCAAALCAAAAPAAAPAPMAASAPFSPEQIVVARQTAFMLSAGTFGEMKPAIDTGGDVTGYAFGARALARWARVLPALFPEGSLTPRSHAKPAIWQNRADFEAKAASYAAAATHLAELAQAGDKAGFAAQWTVVRQSCGACHDLYRVEPPRPAAAAPAH